jgi:hypothetical protein
MVFLRCVWHRRYFGYPALYGVRSWRGPELAIDDGRCAACAERRRAEMRGERPPAPAVPPWLPRLGLALAIVTALVLAARPVGNTDHRPSLGTLEHAVSPPRSHPPRVASVPEGLARPPAAVAVTSPRARPAVRVASRPRPPQIVTARSHPESWLERWPFLAFARTVAEPRPPGFGRIAASCPGRPERLPCRPGPAAVPALAPASIQAP